MSSLCFRTHIQKGINNNISLCKTKIIFKSSTRLANFSGSKISYLCVYILTLFINLRVVDATLPITTKPSAVVSEHLVISCAITYFPLMILEFLLPTTLSSIEKSGLLISRDHPILKKKEHLYHYTRLISYCLIWLFSIISIYTLQFIFYILLF